MSPPPFDILGEVPSPLVRPPSSPPAADHSERNPWSHLEAFWSTAKFFKMLSTVNPQCRTQPRALALLVGLISLLFFITGGLKSASLRPIRVSALTLALRFEQPENTAEFC